VHEYPYLDKPEELEYPTETWAAQDLRKTDIFNFAAKHARDAEREQFLERARFFFDTSVSSLRASSSRTLARPLVLLMAHGFAHSAFTHDVQLAPLATAVPDGFLAELPQFVTQKALATRRALVLGCVSAGLGLAGLAGLVVKLLE
jgi:hypothetical protein